jgi:indole-3-glycerol phosphate synthase
MGAPMSGGRRFSQAISEGDGISLIADVTASGEARAAEAAGAEAIVLRSNAQDVRDATGLPVLWCGDESVTDALSVSADAYRLALVAHNGDDERLEQLYDEAVDLGLECVVEVRDEDELQVALDRVDPEILMLSAVDVDSDRLEHVLALLPDVPAGKLAVAEVEVRDRDDVDELERAGVDGVVVSAALVAELSADAPREH